MTTTDDALAAVRAGADAIGLNFFSGSRRFVSLATAERIAASVPAGVAKVGLFVNAPVEEIQQICDRLQLDFVQLHGDEPPEFLRQIESARLIRALRVGPEGLRPVVDYLQRCDALACRPAAVMWDAFVPGQFGGTGREADWRSAADYPQADRPPLILAGGLTPDNVSTAISAVRPHAVDTASGVESSPGRKDPALMETFVCAARAALDAKTNE